tara:strand:- start:87065 stop:87985 length:921 start_codon:yes stop_codon:yes gene_type:complete
MTLSSSSNVNIYLKKAAHLFALPVSKKIEKWTLFEFPFDSRLLTLSPLYLKSRKYYLELGGRFYPRLCSTMRSLSAQDLFADSIDYSPSESELIWFVQNRDDVTDPEKEIESITRFTEISVFHEQNHRVIWRLLPPAPSEQHDLRRYLNFAESLVVILDLALGDELGVKYSREFEEMRVIYRAGGRGPWIQKNHKQNRNYYLALFLATYYLLEMMNPEDILPALNYVFPGQAAINKAVTKRSLELSELFTRITNPQWQERYWKQASKKLSRIHKGSAEDELYLPEDPLDFGDDLYIVNQVLDHYSV